MVLGVAKLAHGLSGFHGTARQLLEYSGWLLGCSHAVARVIVVVAMVSGGVARVLLGSWYKPT